MHAFSCNWVYCQVHKPFVRELLIFFSKIIQWSLRFIDVYLICILSCLYPLGVRVIKGSVSRLEKIDPEVVPVTTTLARSPQDKVTVRRLKLLMKEWTFEMNTLLQVLDEMTDPKMFILVSGMLYFMII